MKREAASAGVDEEGRGENAPLVLVARIGAAHGIRGEVRVKPFTQTAADIPAYGPLASADGRIFEIEAARPAAGTSPDMLVVRFQGVVTRNAAEALNGI